MAAMQDASSTGTVRGVLNFAVSYQDISFDKMTEEKFQQGMTAKVFGTKRLHEATVSLPLDFFVMISSLTTVYSFPTQSTYMAANNFLDYFARYRRRCGLPASAVSLGFINDLGPLNLDPVTVNLFVRAKGQTMTGSQVLRMLEHAFVSNDDCHQEETHQQWLGYSQDPLSEANIITGIDPAVLATMKRDEVKKANAPSFGSTPRWYRDARVSLMLRALDDAWRYHTQDSSSRGAAQDLDDTADKYPVAQLRREFQTSITKLRGMQGRDKGEAHARTVAFVTDAIRVAVAGMLFVDPSVVNTTKTVAEHGIDSLLAAEFRNWLRDAFGKNISMVDLMDARTKIDALSPRVVDEAIG